jgi:Homeodomain-like domain
MISREREAEILRLFNAERWPVGTIATQLGLHHTTVQRVLAQAGLAPKLVITRPSIVDPYLPFVLEVLVAKEVSINRIFALISKS